MMTSNSNYLVLSCDGGGVRGLVIVLLLQDLSKEFGESFLDSINLFAGTSTGGIIALSLASGVQLTDLVELYKKPQEIFTKFDAHDLNWKDWADLILYLVENGINIFGEHEKELTNNIIDQLKSIQADEIDSDNKNKGGIEELRKLINELIEGINKENVSKLVLPKYSNKGLESVLKEYLKKPLKKLRKNVLVTTFQLNNEAQGVWEPIAITNFNNGEETMDEKSTIQAALCTSAAPTFFPPYQHKKYGYCIDGGLYANNPSLVAVSHLINKGYSLDKIKILSIGTGAVKHKLTIKNEKLTGILEWFIPVESDSKTPNETLLPLLMDGSSSQTDAIFDILSKKNSKRVNVPLNENISLDDIGKVEKLEEITKEYIESAEWQDVKNWIRLNYLP